MSEIVESAPTSKFSVKKLVFSWSQFWKRKGESLAFYAKIFEGFHIFLSVTGLKGKKCPTSCTLRWHFSRIKKWTNQKNIFYKCEGELMRYSLVVRTSDCQCTSCNGPGFDPSIRRHSGVWGAADEAVKYEKNTKIPPPPTNKCEGEWTIASII